MRRPLEDIETPAVLVDRGRLVINVSRMRAVAEREGVNLRPMVKTHKTREIADLQAQYGARGFACATVREAEMLYAYGHRDIFIAHPPVIDLKSLARIKHLARSQKSRIGVMVWNPESASDIHGNFDWKSGNAPDVMLKVDSGLHRLGVQPEKDASFEFVKQLRDMFGDHLRGIFTHAGQVYRYRRPKVLDRVAEEERDTMIRFKERCEQEGIHIREVSIGSTPTIHHFHNDPKKTITEIRPGSYVFGDLTEVELGVTTPAECALTVLARVTDRDSIIKTTRGIRQKVQRIKANVGFKLLMTDKGPHGEGKRSYGAIYADEGCTDLVSGSCVSDASEEECWIEVPDASVYRIQQLIRILVRRAGPVVSASDFLYVTDGKEQVDRWLVEARGYHTRRT